MAFSPGNVRSALSHLCERDPVMRDIIEEVGAFTLRAQRDRFGMLIRSIISQQISVGAARSIRARLQALVEPDKISAESLLRYELDQLRGVGLSPQKASYVIDLAQRVSDGRLQLRAIGRLGDEAVIEALTQVKGIGRWTAQMFLIFALGRLDVFPYDDLGVRMAIRDRYGLDDLPDKQTSTRIAEPWRPYATVGSWYCWRILEASRKAQANDAKRKRK